MAAAGLGQVVSWYVCTIVAVAFACVRQYHQWRRFGRFGIEDGFMVLATGCLIGDLIIQHYMWARGMADLASVTSDDMKAIMQMIVPGSVLYVTSLWAIKFALTLLYKKLAAPNTKIQMVYSAMLGVLAASWIVLFFDIIFQCWPHDKRWSSDPNYQCSTAASNANYWMTILMSIISDVIIICLPISMVLQLKMRLKQKLGVMAMFALGIFVVISGIIRAFYSKKNETMLTCTVSMVETAIAIVAASLPALRSLVRGRGTQTGYSNYGKYELSSPQRGPKSQVTTTIVGGTRRGDNESEVELVNERRSHTSVYGAKSVEFQGGIMVNTAVQLQREPNQPKPDMP